jgi:monofunctional glycosyltransferase
MDPHRPRIEPSLTPAAGADSPREPAPEPAIPAHRARPVLHRHPRTAWQRIRRGLLWLFLTLGLLALVPPGVVLWLRWNPPPTSAFMIQSPVQPVAYQWVPRTRIPESLRDAVVAAEDQKFWTHWGFDFIAIAEALEHNEKSRRKRGASTISQQTAKNLFLWPSRSWLRKGLEVSFTLLLEGLWPKERILEVYLNIAEFGPGVYGVEAAAQKFFRKSADQLSPAETAQLAAVLPNPRKWLADRPGPYVQSRVDWILIHTGHAPRFSAPPAVRTEEPPLEPGADAPDAMTGDAPADEMPSAPEAASIDDEPAAEPDSDAAPDAPAPEDEPADPAGEPAADTAPAEEPARDEPLY